MTHYSPFGSWKKILNKLTLIEILFTSITILQLLCIKKAQKDFQSLSSKDVVALLQG